MRLSDHLRFLARLAANPAHVGAVAPSGRALARAMAAETDPARDGRVLELGPGTGVVTQALIARGFALQRILAVEFDERFAALVRERTGVTVIRGDAFRLGDILDADERFTAVVSSLPLRNFPIEQRRALLADVLPRQRPGAPFVQFSYGLAPPVEPPSGACIRLAAHIWLNLPPAKVWLYRRG